MELLDRVVGRIGNGYRLCVVLGDLNGWFVDRLRICIACGFGVPGEKDNGRRVIDFCAEMESCVGNTYFKHKR